MEVDPGLASVITAVCTGVALWSGHLLARRGQKEQHKLTAAAAALEALVARADRAESAEARERERADRERNRAEALEDECDQLRRDTHIALSNMQAEYDRRHQDMHEVLALLHRTVRSEIVKSAAETVMRESKDPAPDPDEIDRWLGHEPPINP